MSLIKEEPEVKNIEWLKREIGKLPCVDTVFINDGLSYMDSAVPVLPVYELLNQLDEPEVLSQEWIDEQKVARVKNVRKRTRDDVVPVEKLQGILVPKQEEIKVSNMWHDVIAQNKEEGHSLRWALNYIDNL